MSVESIILTVIGLALSVATFFIGRQVSAKNEGEWRGRLDISIEHMKDHLEEISALTKANSETAKAMFDQQRREYRQGISHVHDRMDDHLREDHSMMVPKRRRYESYTEE